jgi:hypothetical protein
MGWDAAQLDVCGALVDQMPVIHPPGQALGDAGPEELRVEGGSSTRSPSSSSPAQAKSAMCW